MYRVYSAFGLVAVLAWGLVQPAVAGDSADEPLYVILDGRLIPTRIIPPRARSVRVPTAARAQPAADGVRSPGVAEDTAAPSRGHAAGRLRQSAAGDSMLPADETQDAQGESGAAEQAPPPYPRYPRFPGLSPYYQPFDWYGPYGYPSYQTLMDIYDAQRDAERRDAERRFNERDMAERKERVLRSHDEAVEIGLERLKSGEYQQAMIALTLAAELDQGDPGCRIHLAQARMALGHYEEAGQALRRALQLQPKLVYIPLNLDQYYDRADTFDEHVDALAKAAQNSKQPADVSFLLGFMQFQRGKYELAYAAFQAAARGSPKDSLTTTYLKITRPPTTHRGNGVRAAERRR